ncbi:MAG: type IV pilus secretin PilQ [Elusimicrobia bacterium]|nr:type IV pilus secretin PilQ [Elusimicrobiota bacterium]
MTTHDLKKAVAALLTAALIIPQGAVAAYAASAASPAPAAAASFRGVDVSDDLVTIKLSTAVQYNSFLTQTPPRLILELLDTKHETPVRSAKGKGRYLAGVRTSQFRRTPRMITRVVLDLVKMGVYKVSAVPAGLAVQLIGSNDSAAVSPKDEDAPEVAEAAAPARAPAPAPPAHPVIVPKAAAPAAAPAAPVAMKAEPAAEPAPRRVRDLSPAAAFRRAGLVGKMKTELVAGVEAENVTRSKIKIPTDVGDEDPAKRALGGRIFRDLISRLPRDPISLDFDNTDVRDVIKLLASKAKINIIYGSDVTGTLTLHLTDVPFNEAFRTVLSMMQLSTDQVGDNILRVITPAELTKQRTSATAVTKVVPLNYAKAANVKATIDSVRQAEGRSGSSSVDTASNALIITESLEGMLATENLINQLDQRPRQVLIEAKLIEVNENSGLNYGIQWDYAGSDQSSIGGKPGTNLIGTTSNPGATRVQGVGATGRGTGVNLNADRIFGAMTVGRITNNYFLTATLTAAASEGKAKVLSDPKIATLNNQAANINVTTQIPYVTSNVASTGVQTQTVQYVTTGIQMTVTPSINADGRILLQINPNVSQPSVTSAGSTQTGAPAIDSRNANTTILVRDGETIVIGGLISDNLQDTISKIPLLGDIPVLGWLFKKRTKTRVRNELLIFVTTRILPD